MKRGRHILGPAVMLASTVTTHVGVAAQQPLLKAHVVPPLTAVALTIAINAILLDIALVSGVLKTNGGFRETFKSGGSKMVWLVAGIMACSTGIAISNRFSSARLPLGTGASLLVLGPLALSFWITLKAQKLSRNLLLPLFSAAGAILMIPWGQGQFDLKGCLAALGGAACFAGQTVLVKAQARAGFNNIGTAITASTSALLFAAPVLILTAGEYWWTPPVLIRSGIAGLAMFLSNILYNWATGRLDVPVRISGILASCGPAVSCAAGYLLLGQQVWASAWIGMILIFVSGVITTLTGPTPTKVTRRAML